MAEKKVVKCSWCKFNDRLDDSCGVEAQEKINEFTGDTRCSGRSVSRSKYNIEGTCSHYKDGKIIGLIKWLMKLVGH